jgi:CO/xanthine dehydrogenase Mo-binding subunit
VGIKECLQRVQQQREDAVSLVPGAEGLRGTGVGAMWYGIGNTGVKNPASARVELDREGKFVLYTGAADIGQGSNTVLSQIAASAMGTRLDQVRLVHGDTAFTPDAGATSASRQTYISGNAVMQAAARLRDLVLEHASRYLQVNVNDIAILEGMITSQEDGRALAPLEDVAARSHQEGKPLEAEAAFNPETSLLDPETGQGNPYATYAFACHMAEVDVDAATGEVDVLRIVAAHDVGKAVNPLHVEGQIAGGVAMGLGFALMEEFVPGKTSFAHEYMVPTVRDVPAIIPIIVEDPEPSGPYGAKGVGEPALIPTAPAILNAIAQAAGVRIYHLPATKERVFMACRQLRSGRENTGG